MKKLLTFGILALILPTLALASSCPDLNRNLKKGMSGPDVQQLQQFLIDQGFLGEGNDSGYFGNLTQKAVQQFQCQYMSICSGSPSTNGYGNVGPATRAKIAEVCAEAHNLQPASTPLSCTLNVNPSAIMTGQSSTLTWSSTNAAGGTILPSIGDVPATGSRTLSPLTSTTYTGSFDGFDGSITQCAPTTLTVSTVPLTSCTPDPTSPQTQTLSCPAGQTGSITQQRTSSCAQGATSPTWGAWVTTANTCVSVTTTARASCTTGGGQTVADGQTLDYCEVGHGIGVVCQTITNPIMQCTNGQWTNTGNLCTGTPFCGTALTGSATQPSGTITATPSSGVAPLSVTFNGTYTQQSAASYLFNFGDGASMALNATCMNGICTLQQNYHTHTYTAAGTYQASVQTSTGTVLGQTSVTVSGSTGTAPSISITAPSSGAMLTIGSTATISWTSTNAPMNATSKAYIQSSSGQQYNIGVLGTASGSAGWTVPSIPPGSYTLYAKLLGSNLVTELASDSRPVTISSTAGAPSIIVSAPLSGANVARGTPFTVAWQSFNVPLGARIGIRFVTVNGSAFPMAGLAPISGAYTITVPNNATTYPDGASKVRVYMTNSDGTQILASTEVPVTLTATVTTAPPDLITVTSPAPGSITAKGTLMTISWTTHDAPAGSFINIYAEQSNGVFQSTTIATNQSVNGTVTWDTSNPSYSNAYNNLHFVLLDASYHVIYTTKDVPITITTTGMAPSNQTQLASALTALESALQQILKLLGN